MRAIMAAAFRGERGSMGGISGAGAGGSLKVFLWSVSESSLDSGLVLRGCLPKFLGLGGMGEWV